MICRQFVKVGTISSKVTRLFLKLNRLSLQLQPGAFEKLDKLSASVVEATVILLGVSSAAGYVGAVSKFFVSLPAADTTTTL